MLALAITAWCAAPRSAAAQAAAPPGAGASPAAEAAARDAGRAAEAAPHRAAPGAQAAARRPGAPAAQLGVETIVIVEGVDDGAAAQRRRALGAAPFVTLVEADDHRGQLLSVAEALSATVGASVRSAGGVAGSSSLSIRGAASGHTGVLVDGIALSRLTAVSVNLGRFQLADVDAVELYRGNVPAELGGAGVGGAVNLITRLGPGRGGERVRAVAGVGSWGTRRLALRGGEQWRRYLGSAGIGYLTSDGDYRVFSDAGTPLNREDDPWQVRQNNATRQLDASARVGVDPAQREDTVTVGARLSAQHSGLPGLVAAPALRASLSTTFALLDLDHRQQGTRWSVRDRAWVTGEWQRFRDRDNEIGLAAQDRAHRTLGVGASSQWKLPIGQHQLAQLGLEASTEHFRDRDAWKGGPTYRGARQGAALSLGDELAVDEWLLAAALRVELSRTAPSPLPDELRRDLPTRWDVSPSPRLTARVLAEQDVAFKASAGWYARQPTLVELFGDRGFVVGNPELRPETGPSWDLGLVWAPARAIGPVDRTLVEFAGFYNHLSDAIVFVNAGYVSHPTNVGAASNVGLELAASTRLWRTARIAANYTLQLSQQEESEDSFDRKDLPRHPRHTAYARLELEHALGARQLRGYGELQWTSSSFLDRANLQRVPARQLVGAGLSVALWPQLTFAVEAKNLLDHQIEQLALAPGAQMATTPVAVSDISGLPLPGRSLFLSVEWSR
jgi:vitamin B12 transporter